MTRFENWPAAQLRANKTQTRRIRELQQTTDP